MRPNNLGQPIGDPVEDWMAPIAPPAERIVGRYCRLEPLSAERHAKQLWEANDLDRERRNWTYLTYGPYATLNEYREWVRAMAAGSDPVFFAIVTGSNRATGVAAYLRIMPDAGSIEVGHINYSPLLQRTPAATEAMYLMMRRAFELGYRRYEWKCDSLNAPSRRAAQRLGFSYEGVFRNAMVTKGRNRDTAWYAAIDSEWPALRDAFERWLDPSNFDAEGGQRLRLSDLTAPILVRAG
jgi:RimJ/RimL family protein N-acetyltransferase